MEVLALSHTSEAWPDGPVLSVVPAVSRKTALRKASSCRGVRSLLPAKVHSGGGWGFWETLPDHPQVSVPSRGDTQLQKAACSEAKEAGGPPGDGCARIED